MYIVEEEAMNTEQIEEISQTVKAKSYISDEMWSMAESAFRGAVVGVNAAVAGKYYAGGEESMGGSDSTYIPDKAKDIANQVKAKNGAVPKGYKGGKVYKNMPKEGMQKLPEGVNYKEYDVNPYVKGQNRGMERIIVGDDGSVWYTNDHYETFTKIE